MAQGASSLSLAMWGDVIKPRSEAVKEHGYHLGVGMGSARAEGRTPSFEDQVFLPWSCLGGVWDPHDPFAIPTGTVIAQLCHKGLSLPVLPLWAGPFSRCSLPVMRNSTSPQHPRSHCSPPEAHCSPYCSPHCLPHCSPPMLGPSRGFLGRAWSSLGTAAGGRQGAAFGRAGASSVRGGMDGGMDGRVMDGGGREAVECEECARSR